MSSASEKNPETLPPGVRQLRSRWKDHKTRLQKIRPAHPTTVRFHRACSWMQVLEERQAIPLDEVLIFRWIAFNALYGQWDSQLQQPRPDRECWRKFLDRIRQLDQAGLIPLMLQHNKRLVLALLEDPYLNGFFWKEPSEQRAKKSRHDKTRAQSWFVEKRWANLLDEVLERIYVLRCQMIHGAATHSSRLNRKSLKHCCLMLGHLLPTVLTVITDHGSEEDWGDMCYPPLS